MAYERINWEDAPSTKTPINAKNLNKMDEALYELSEQKVDKTGITLAKHTDGLVYLFVDGVPVGIGLDLTEGGTVEPDGTVVVPEYSNITWCTDAYTVGSTSAQYNGWIPHNLQYDEVNDKFLLLGCHRTAHTGTYSNITLHELDAVDPTVQTELNVPTYSALGCLLVDNGVWYIYSRLSNIRYKSEDLGTTWTEENLTIETNVTTEPAWFGMFKENNTYFGCTDAYWNTYFKSEDGLNWLECSFTGDNTVQDSENIGKEGGIAYFNGYYYAFLRSDTIQYARVYKSETAESGTWILVDEETIPSYQSCPMPIVYKDRISCVTTNRGDGHLYYCFLDENDAIEVNDFGLRSLNPTSYGDFITANIAYDGEHAIIAYCTMSSFDGVSTTDYQVCETVALYGKVGTENNIPSIVETLESVTEQQSGNADLTKLGITLYPSDATLTDGSINSTVTNNNDFNVFGVFDENPINKMFLVSETSIRAYGSFYPIKNGKIALPSAEWGSNVTPSANFNANHTYDWMQCIEINGKLYLWCNKNGEKTLLRRDSFVYGATLDGCPNYDDLRKMLYVPSGATKKYVLRNVKFIETISRS